MRRRLENARGPWLWPRWRARGEGERCGRAGSRGAARAHCPLVHSTFACVAYRTRPRRRRRPQPGALCL